jgi:hypothetical protein
MTVARHGASSWMPPRECLGLGPARISMEDAAIEARIEIWATMSNARPARVSDVSMTC